MFSPPTAPSVGHRPSSPLSDYGLELNGDYGYFESYIPIPGMLLKARMVGRVSDLDSKNIKLMKRLPQYVRIIALRKMTHSMSFYVKSRVNMKLLSARIM